jgi:hypothetical protein
MCDMAEGATRGARRWLVTLAAALGLGLTACGSASDPSPPSGVDGLMIPTPSLDPRDFADDVDNRWLPLSPGSTWTYELSGAQSGQVSVSVSDQGRAVSEVEATVVETSWPDHHTTDYYAQDDAGNVWWLGREGLWEAGAAGAEAGLAMPARPRVGDGYRMAGADGAAEDQAQVRSVLATVTVPAGHYEDCVDVETSSPLVPGVRLLQTYADGVGLVRAVSLEGPAVSLELTATTAG